ncbi:MAG: hypothetical protein ACTSVO_10465 [Candidatus Heimdallarchaeaceae archaeon]
MPIKKYIVPRIASKITYVNSIPHAPMKPLKKLTGLAILSLQNEVLGFSTYNYYTKNLYLEHGKLGL